MMSFQEALDKVNQEVTLIKYPESPECLYAPIRYILSHKGKKVRPVLTLLACDLYAGNVESALSTALSWEIFHNFTLMHDDVMDNADVRRNQPTVHKVWNENTAVLSGDAMLIMAYQYIAKSPEKNLKELIDLFSSTAMEICEGQQYDMEFETRLDVTEDEYLDMIRLKTAVLLGASLKSGAIIGGASEKDAQELYHFGVNIGLAFQIKDDFLDVYGDPKVFGKNIGGDILCNKKTYLLVKALELSKGNDKKELLDWISSKQFNEQEKIKAITYIYNKIGIREIAEEKMSYFFQKALDSLSQIDADASKKEVLLGFADQLMRREY